MRGSPLKQGIPHTWQLQTAGDDGRRGGWLLDSHHFGWRAHSYPPREDRLSETTSLPWFGALRGDPLPWLLEEDNPCVRFRTLTELLGWPADHGEVVRAREAAWRWPPVQLALERVSAPAEWRGRLNNFRLRDLDVLGLVGVPAGHPAMAAACERLLGLDLMPESADCYAPQVAAGVLRYGDPADTRPNALLHAVIRNERLADGNRPGVLRYGGAGACCGSHSCMSAVARSLRAAASIPEETSTTEVRDFRRRGAEYLAAHRVYQSNHHGYRPIRKGLLRLHLPFGLDWRTDLLDLLDVATQVGLHDSPAIADAVRYVIGRQDNNGRWPLDERYDNRRDLSVVPFWDLETVGEPSKWVTLTALLQLKRCAPLVQRLLAGEQLLPPAAKPQPVFAYESAPSDTAIEAASRARWLDLGMAPVLERMLDFAKENGLHVGWHRQLTLGPDFCPEWLAAEVRLVPAKNMKGAWPVARLFFLAPEGQFTAPALAERLQMSLQDPYPGKGKSGSWLEDRLWRVRVEQWRAGWDEVGLVLREPSQIQAVATVMSESLAGLRR